MTTTHLFIILGVLLCLSAFFSGSETALMRVSPFRLRALARDGHLGAKLAEKLLARPDRLIGVILACNNAVNVAATLLTGAIAVRLGGGEGGQALAGLILVFVILIFSELTPKTLAAVHPERVALPSALVYYPLLFICYPAVWFVNLIANGLLRLIGVRVEESSLDTITRDELLATVAASGGAIPIRRRNMLMRILELEDVTVEDIMVPRSDILGIDLDDDWNDIVTLIKGATHTRLPVYRESLDEVLGVVHLRNVAKSIARGQLDKEKLEEAILPPYFVPDNTPLNKQLVNFQAARQRFGLVVDEYGDLQGIVTLDDLLQEIVGEFTPGATPTGESVIAEDDGTFVVAGAANVRTLNRTLRWQLPVDGAKTVNGIVTEELQTIPKAGTELEISGYVMTVLRTQGNAIGSVRVRPPAQPENHD
ncbi:MAG: HlyC/CorC family transporter [Pseudomonadota bacterium]